MKIETAVIVTKGLCFVVIGAGTPAVTGLAQWFDSGMWPPTINWIGIAIGAMVGGATQMLAFLSQSFGDYKEQLKTGDTVSAQAPPDKTKVPERK